MPEQPPLLVMLVGPPAVGKMTIGQGLRRLTGIPLFYNHQIIDVMTEYFEFGSPPFNRVVQTFTDVFMQATAESGHSLAVTWGWRFDMAEDAEAVARYTQPFLDAGGRVCVAELYAPFETRLERNRTENRRAHKKTDWATNEWLATLESQYRYRSNGTIGFDFEHLELDVSEIAPDEAARIIAERFEIPVRDVT